MTDSRLSPYWFDLLDSLTPEQRLLLRDFYNALRQPGQPFGNASRGPCPPVLLSLGVVKQINDNPPLYTIDIPACQLRARAYCAVKVIAEGQP
jgi:hypothetical protein